MNRHLLYLQVQLMAYSLLSLSEASNKIKTLRKKCITLDDKVKGLQKTVEKLTDTFTIVMLTAHYILTF